jgi:hypothetical protein
VESIYRFVIFRSIELGLVHACSRYCRRSDKQHIGEAFNLGSLPPDFIFPDWNDNFAPNTFSRSSANVRETGERKFGLDVLGNGSLLNSLLGEGPDNRATGRAIG